MRVIEKSEELFQDIERISDLSFPPGVERPGHLAIKWSFENGDVFVHRRFETMVVGYAIVTQDGGQPFLWSLAVDPSWRRRGIASELLAEIAFYYSPDNERVDLTVHVNNPAQKLYFDYGFRAVRVLPRYYGEASGLRMRRLL